MSCQVVKRTSPSWLNCIRISSTSDSKAPNFTNNIWKRENYTNIWNGNIANWRISIFWNKMRKKREKKNTSKSINGWQSIDSKGRAPFESVYSAIHIFFIFNYYLWWGDSKQSLSWEDQAQAKAPNRNSSKRHLSSFTSQPGTSLENNRAEQGRCMVR